MNETPPRTETERIAMIHRFGFDEAPIACRTLAGSDACIYEAGHSGPHGAIWGGGVLMTWTGDEPFSHDFSVVS